MRNSLKVTCVIIMFAVILIVNGAVPFLAIPTAGQAIWLTGFSQSFANQTFFSIYANNFGLPNPAPIAFGLSGAWPISILLRFNMQPADAYSTVFALWFLVAFLSAIKIGKLFGLRFYESAAVSFLWMLTPSIWGHDGYSMLSVAIALLPFYFSSFFSLLYFKGGVFKKSVTVVVFILACWISIFADGYTFIMFITGSMILLVYSFLICSNSRRANFKYIVWIYVAGVASAYLLYSKYIGMPSFRPASMAFFRAWAADITFFLLPSEGIHWLPDILGLSVHRSQKLFFGDDSVWITTFSLPLVIIGIISFLKLRKRERMIYGIAFIAFFGFYMALGPSFKFNLTKTENSSQFLPENFSLISTGTSLISENVPGFRNMRASYRWTALGMFSLWLLTVLYIKYLPHRRYMKFIVLFMLCLPMLPHVDKRWSKTTNFRKMIITIEEELILDFKKMLPKNEKVSFLPYQNDFFANYISSRVGIKTYNIGGDKNLEMARVNWPENMQKFKHSEIDKDFTENVISVLTSGEADAVIFPFFDMLWAPHAWPYPSKFMDVYPKIEHDLLETNRVNIIERPYYRIIRLKASS
jgi:hypothetical protein